MLKIDGYQPGDQTLRMQVYADSRGGCLNGHLTDLKSNMHCTESAVARAIALAHEDHNDAAEARLREMMATPKTVVPIKDGHDRTDALAI